MRRAGKDISAEAAQQIALGKCFSVIDYGQLVAENCVMGGIPTELVSLIFHALVADLTAEALALAVLFPLNSPQRAALESIVCVPETSAIELQKVSDWMRARYGG